MKSFVDVNLVKVLHFFQFVEDWNLRSVYEAQVLPIVSGLLEGKALDYFLAPKNASYYSGLSCCSEYAN